MNTNLIKNAIIFCLLLFSNICNAQYHIEHEKECDFTLRFFAEYKTKFEAASKTCHLSAEFLFAIVAPEISQFSYLSNKLETYSLKVFYVQNGKAYADFSIGVFQMKPSFIERLEEYIYADSLLRVKYASCLFSAPEARASRVERIGRLSTVKWQMTYLALFCETVNRKFGNLAFSNEDEKLRFYASAYNCGFHKSEQQIKETAQKSLFPHFSSVKYRYDDIALWFYNRK